MLRTTEERRKAFKKALVDAGMTARAFAEQQNVSEDHLHACLSGRRFSKRLLTEVDRFIEVHQPVAA